MNKHRYFNGSRGVWSGQQLPAETGFGKFSHPQTGERGGAWLVMFLRERQFSYWASDAYDRRRDWPLATGGLANPPLSAWQATLTETAALLSASQVPRTAALVEKVRAEVETWKSAYNNHRSAPGLLQTMRQEMDGLLLHPWSGAIREGLLTSRELASKTAAAHAKGETAFAALLEKARQSLASVRVSDAETRRMAADHARLNAQDESAFYPHSEKAAALLQQARTALAAFPAARESGDGGSLLAESAEKLAAARLTEEPAIRRARNLRYAGKAGGALGTNTLLLAGCAGNLRRPAADTSGRGG